MNLTKSLVVAALLSSVGALSFAQSAAPAADTVAKPAAVKKQHKAKAHHKAKKDAAMAPAAAASK